MNVETLNKTILLLAASFPGIDFNPEVYEEMLSELPDEFFLKAVYDFIKTTKEIYPGTNPIAILREKALSLVPKVPYVKPMRTAEELRKINDMQEYYDRQKEKTNQLVLSAIPKVNK